MDCVGVDFHSSFLALEAIVAANRFAGASEYPIGQYPTGSENAGARDCYMPG
jgi:hypothetical protein